MTRRSGKRPGPGAPERERVRPAQGFGSRKQSLLASATVFALACSVFLPTLRASFLNWDDNVYVLQNPWIREVTWANLVSIFTRPYFQNYLPLHLLSYMLDHALWGLRAGGYHLTSVLLHGANTVLCLAVARRLSGSLWVGLLAAVLFAVHPAHVEAVAWVSSRKEVLSTTFLLLSLLAYLSARAGSRIRPIPYAASVAWFLLGLLSKVSVVVLPAFLLLLDWMPDPRRKEQRPSLLHALASKIPYAILGVILIAVNSQAQVTAKAAYAQEPFRYLTVKGHAVWNYLLLLFGFGGSPNYDLPEIGAGLLAFVNLAGLLLLPAAAIVLYRTKRREEFLGLSWVFLTLLPALLFPLVTYMADRYLYAPSVGFCVALAVLLVGTRQRGDRPMASPRLRLAMAITVALALFYSIRTLRYARVWRDSESLWTYAITKSRDYRVFNNLADVRMTQKRWDEAERLLRQGAGVENVTSYQSLGVLYYNLRRFDEALAATDRALQIQSRKAHNPSLEAELHYNRGAILWSRGDTPAAIQEWRAALGKDPAHAQAREWLRTTEPRP